MPDLGGILRELTEVLQRADHEQGGEKNISSEMEKSWEIFAGCPLGCSLPCPSHTIALADPGLLPEAQEAAGTPQGTQKSKIMI